MGVGRNLAYKKEEFFNVNGFIEHMQIRSGDDDLFINQAAKAKTQLLLTLRKVLPILNQKHFQRMVYSKKKTCCYSKILQNF